MVDQQPIIDPAPESPDWATHATSPAGVSSLVDLAEAVGLTR